MAFREFNVAGDHTAANEMVRISGQRGVPVIVIDGQVVVGFDRPRLEQLLAQREGSPEAGMAITSAEAYAAKRGLRLPAGAYVGRVSPGGAAARAGVQAGDVVTALAGQPVRSDRELEALLRGHQGRRVPLAVWRNGESRVLELVLQES